MAKTIHSSKTITHFQDQLVEYKQLIDSRIAQYCTALETETAEHYGEYPLLSVKSFTDYLSRGGKRIRGALAIVGYQMAGGKDMDMIVDAALAIEMLQNYILMMDDIQDRSETRRGGPTAHIMMKQFHEKRHLKDDSQHFGESITMNSFVIGLHLAMDVLATLDAQPDRILHAIRNVNGCFVTTGHGQTIDIFNEVVGEVGEEDVNKVLIWKTAYYTFVNPLQLGAILAGASEEDLEAIVQYSLPAGRAFQITDDILGIYGTEFESGKSPLDDIKEGKRTILTTKALELASKTDGYYLEQCLGKQDLTMTEFKRCQEIIAMSGALDYAKSTAADSVAEAVDVLESSGRNWQTTNVDFLKGLALYLGDRKS